MASNKAPKQEKLTSHETLNSFKNWKANLTYTLSLDKAFTPFLKDGVTWQKLSSAHPARGFQDDTGDSATKQTKEEKCATLNLMLGQIANWATVISRNQIVNNSTSLNDVWDKIRQHYGFHATGSRFLDLTTVKLEAGDRPEDLYQRLVSFVDDNLLTAGSTITHHAEAITSNEEVTPSLENVIVVMWLERLHVRLPGLVKQRYGAELRNKTLASIKPEISQALSSLLEELSVSEDSRISRAQSFQQPKRGSFSRGSQRGGKYCCLCRTANRPNYEDHFLSQCRYLPESDRRRFAKIRNVEIVDDYDNYDDYDDHDDHPADSELVENQHGAVAASSSREDSNRLLLDPPISILRRVTTRKSPRMECFHGHILVVLLLDTGAESNLMGERTCRNMGLRYHRTNQGAQQVDMKTPLSVIGEVKGVKISKGANVFVLDALVIKDDIGDIVAGEPFLELNDIALRPAKQQIIVHGREVIPYASL